MDLEDRLLKKNIPAKFSWWDEYNEDDRREESGEESEADDDDDDDINQGRHMPVPEPSSRPTSDETRRIVHLGIGPSTSESIAKARKNRG